MAELNSLLPILVRADGMSRDNASSFGALGMVLVKGVLAYILLRLGRSQEGLEVGSDWRVGRNLPLILEVTVENVFYLLPLRMEVTVENGSCR